MALEQEFKEKITMYVEECLKPHGVDNRFLHKAVWEFEHRYDFTYGQKTGFILGLISGSYLEKYGTNPSEIEMEEIADIVSTKIPAYSR